MVYLSVMNLLPFWGTIIMLVCSGHKGMNAKPFSNTHPSASMVSSKQLCVCVHACDGRVTSVCNQNVVVDRNNDDDVDDDNMMRRYFHLVVVVCCCLLFFYSLLLFYHYQCIIIISTSCS